MRFAWQPERRGTGHAVSCAMEQIPVCDDVMILCGDTPLITGDMLVRLFESHLSAKAHVSLVTAVVDDPGDYGRMRRDATGAVLGIVEAKDLLPGDGHIREINAGIYIVNKGILAELVSTLDDRNAKGEFYLTDIVEKAAQAGYAVNAFVCEDASLIQGVNDRYALAFAESRLRETVIRNLCLGGVAVRDPRNTYIDPGVTIGRIPSSSRGPSSEARRPLAGNASSVPVPRSSIPRWGTTRRYGGPWWRHPPWGTMCP